MVPVCWARGTTVGTSELVWSKGSLISVMTCYRSEDRNGEGEFDEIALYAAYCEWRLL